MTKRIRILVLSIVAVAAVAVVALAVVRRSHGAALEEVETHTVGYDALTETVSGTGSLVPSERRTIFSKVGGVVQHVRVAEGSPVREGDILLHIDDTDYAQSLERARISFRTTRRSALQQILNLQSSYSAAVRAVAKVRRTHANNAELRRANAISQEQFQQSEEALADAEESLRLAREQLNLYTGRSIGDEPLTTAEEAEEVVDVVPEVRQAALAVEQASQALQDTTPRATLSGTIATVAVEEGTLVAPNAPLVRIERLDSMNAEVQIDEVDIGKLSVGNSAVVTSDSILGEELGGTVVSIAPTVQRVGNTRVSTVEVSVDSGGMQLKSGASCTVRITTTTKDRALAIPITAYQNEGEEVFVYVLEAAADTEEDRYRLNRATIELGIVTVNLVEVVDGLAVGDLIATGNVSRLRDGMIVAKREAQ